MCVGTTPSAGRGGGAGAWELLSQVSPADPGYGGVPGHLLLGFSLWPGPSFPTSPSSLICAGSREGGCPMLLATPTPGLPSVPASPPLPSPASCHTHLFFATEESSRSCRLFTELRNLSKGPCQLDQVEVSYCSGHCPSSTNVMPEVSPGLLTCRAQPGGHKGHCPFSQHQQAGSAD